jgi:hypothetical protein
MQMHLFCKFFFNLPSCTIKLKVIVLCSPYITDNFILSREVLGFKFLLVLQSTNAWKYIQLSCWVSKRTHKVLCHMLFSIKRSYNNNLTTTELSTMQLKMKIYKKKSASWFSRSCFPLYNWKPSFNEKFNVTPKKDFLGIETTYLVEKACHHNTLI